MSLLPGIKRKDTCTYTVGTVKSNTMNPPTPQEYGRLSGTNADGTSSTAACWGGAGANAAGL